jgi:putative DNA primase/helicase
MSTAAMTTPLEHASDLCRRGYAVVPVPYRKKGATIRGWPDLRISESELSHYFNGRPQNIGVLLGAPSGNRVDVDLDDELAVSLADSFLPPTDAVWGRPSKPRSHRVFAPTSQLAAESFFAVKQERIEGKRVRKIKMIVEIRSDRKLSMAPGSIHPSGEAVAWELAGQPAQVDPFTLRAAVLALANTVFERANLGEAQWTKSWGPKHPSPRHPSSRPIDLLRQRLAERGIRVNVSGTGLTCCCPSHDDQNPSLSIGEGEDGRVLLHCFAGCSPESIVAALGMRMSDLFPSSEAQRRSRKRGNPPSRVSVVSDSSEALRGPPTTDLANAERFAARCASRLRFCHGTGEWLMWDGKRWKADAEGIPIREAGFVARDILKEAARCADGHAREELAEWAIESESRARLEAMVALARSQPSLVVQVSQLDANPWLLNVANGTIDLRSGGIRPHDRADLITQIAPTVYDIDAECPLFTSFLNTIFAGNLELMGFVQRWHGHALTGDVSEQYLPIYFGVGANGKSVLIDTALEMMGDYAGLAPPYLLVESRGQREHPTEIADLLGRRLVIASETEEGATLKLQLVKRLTGDRTLKGRRMRQDYFEFARTHKLIMVTNNKPVVRENTEGVWRRLRLVPFDVVIPEPQRDPRLLDKLRAEHSGILSWAVQGCLDWQRLGLGAPPAVSQATAAYRRGENQVARFLEERCVVESPHESQMFTPWTELWTEYATWAAATGEHPLSPRDLMAALDRAGYPTAKRWRGGRNVTGRPGIGLLSRPSEEGCP